MCGIAGWLGDVDNAEGCGERMARALHHRGPDAFGTRSWPEATLVHTRLSIIDVSPRGAQPIANEDGTIWAIVNGEIYNHQEIRRSLKASGHRFNGYSDSEVLPHLYEEKGLAFVNELRGMFALAIYDTRKRLLILARDRFGIKPLFYSLGHQLFGFASEIRALRQLPGIDEQPDVQAISDYAALCFIPAPQTFFKGIRALLPGELMLASMDGDYLSREARIYHHWEMVPNPSMTMSQATEQADNLIRAAVNQQVESDVPLGALLSGGIDSSLICAAAQDATDKPLETFNVRFSEREFDETWAAVAVSEHIGSRHQILNMEQARGTWDYVSSVLMHCGQPFADTSLFAVHAVSQLMRQHVTVALSGDGGDEGFGGYSLYWQMERIARLQQLPSFVWRTASLILPQLARWGLVGRSIPQRVRDLHGVDDTGLIQNMFCWIREEEHTKLLKNQNVQAVRRWFERQWGGDLPRELSRLDRLSAHATEVNARLILPNDFLFKVDIASMREGLEIRVPMLDEDLFAFGLSLPHRLKVKGQMTKRVLRAVASRRLPTKVASKPKWGFGIPVDSWVQKDVKARMRALLLGSSCRLPEFFCPEAYQSIVEAFCDERPYPGISRQGLYQRAIMLLSLQLALDSEAA